MKKKTVAGEPSRTLSLSEIAKQKLDQVTGAADAAVNPLYTPLTSGGSNSLH